MSKKSKAMESIEEKEMLEEQLQSEQKPVESELVEKSSEHKFVEQKPVQSHSVSEKKHSKHSNEKILEHELDIVELGNKVKQKLALALNKKPNACASIKKISNNLWHAVIEIVEEEHIPSKFDLIGLYEVDFDEKLNLKSWEKVSQRIRG